MKYALTGICRRFNTMEELEHYRKHEIEKNIAQIKLFQRALEDEREFKKELRWRVGYPSIKTKDDVREELVNDIQNCRKRIVYLDNANVIFVRKGETK